MFLFAGVLIWGFLIWKAIECFKWVLMGHPSRDMENIGAEGYLESGDHSYDVLVKNIVAFCSCLKAKVKKF
jgi:hypothetical protein